MRKSLAGLWMLVATAALPGCDGGTPVSAAGAGGASAAPGTTLAIKAADEQGRRLERIEGALDSRDQRIRELEKALGERDAKLEELSKTILDLVARIESVASKQGGEMQTLEAELSRAAARELELKRRLDDLAKVIDTLRANSLVPNAGREVPKIDGRVISVEKQTPGGPAPLVLLDRGRNHGVDLGMELTIARAGRSVAKVRVEQVYADITGARVVFVSPGESVREGDTATTRAN